MDAIQLIEDNLDVDLILEHYDFDHITPSGNYLRGCCKLHGGNNPTGFVINQDTGVWSCHTGDCGNGNIFHLVQTLENVSFPVSVHKVADILKLNIGEMEIVAKTQQEKKELKSWLKTMKAFHRDAIDEYMPIGDTVEIKKFKEFQSSTIEKFGLVYYKAFSGVNSNDEPFTLHNRLGFPIIFDGKQIGVSLRATKAGDNPKWLHQPTSLRTGNILYNYENAIGQKGIVIVEGITDVWAYHEIGITAVCTYGARVTDEQRRLLLMLGCDLIFSFDGDEAGQKAMRTAYDTFSKTSNISFVHLPLGNDPESIKREELKINYEKRKHFPI